MKIKAISLVLVLAGGLFDHGLSAVENLPGTAKSSAGCSLSVPAAFAKIQRECGGKFVAVEDTRSMEPTFGCRSILIIARAKYSDLKAGDIVCFEVGGVSRTHRIVKKTHAGFVTKGDAYKDEDLVMATRSNITGRAIAAYHVDRKEITLF